jgi:hypothetical protein
MCSAGPIILFKIYIYMYKLLDSIFCYNKFPAEESKILLLLFGYL